MAKIGIVGWGVEGQSAYRYFGPQHEYLIVNEEPRDDFPPQSPTVKVQFLEKQRSPGLTGNVTDLSYLKGLEACDNIVYSPTSYKNLHKAYGDDPDFWVKATTDRHIFFKTSKSKNIIGVTGTKGKGTTATLIYKMLQAAGKKTYLGGNIGKSVLDFVRDVQPDDWVVLELSNFQLHHFTYSPHIAVCLMIVPEHLDWHLNMEEYVKAKASIFLHQTASDVAIYFADNPYSTQIAGQSKGKKIPYYKSPGAYVRGDGLIVIGKDEIEVMPKSEVKLLGEHNLQNACAALTAFSEAAWDLDTAKQVLSSFSGLEHRLELVRSLEGVKYYDDSFGTTPDTAIVAMKSFSEPKIMILGGSDKGVPFDGLADEVTKNNVKHVITIGKTGPLIAELLRQRGFRAITEGIATMPEIVTASRQQAAKGDVVLLSTGSASFGLFKDYKDRGNQFKAAVAALA